MILAGDIGGTNTRLALVTMRERQSHVRATAVYPSARYAGLHEIVEQFLGAQNTSVQAACFGIAGPVQNGRCAAMNLKWIVDQRELSARLSLPNFWLINDLVANAYGIACLGPDDIAVINEGRADAEGHAAVISPGTGLGEAGMFWDGRRYYPFASEGGHSDFAPHGQLEFDLGEYLEQRYDHVSFERVLSGPGLVNIFEFLRDTGHGVQPDWLAEEMKTGDPAAAISQAALSGRCPLSDKALDLFLRIYGAEAGNLALKFMATGGVWLGGGIVVKIVDRLKSTDAFRSGFTSKGRLEHLVKDIPVRVILNDRTALLGAAWYAANHDES